jgi:hypothetical protein
MFTSTDDWKTTESLRQLGIRNISHTPRCHLDETRALIWFSRLLASTSYTSYRAATTIKPPSSLYDQDLHKLCRSCRQQHHDANERPTLRDFITSRLTPRNRCTTPPILAPSSHVLLVLRRVQFIGYLMDLPSCQRILWRLKMNKKGKSCPHPHHL